MAASTSPLLLDRISFGVIFGLVAGTAMAFGGVYWALDAMSPENGIDGYSRHAGHWTEYFYFSVVTQATIGYGDFWPLGWSRFVASIHGGIGIILNGLLVAKITTSAISRYRVLRKQACDDWVDIVRHRDGRVEVGALRLAWDDGALQLSGRNFSPSGVLVDSFHAYLIEDDWPRSLTFRYTSHEGTADYAEGYVTLWFHGPQGGVPVSFSASVRDQVKVDTKPVIRGWRILDTERDLIEKLHDPRNNAEVVTYFLKKYLPHVPELPKPQESARKH